MRRRLALALLVLSAAVAAAPAADAHPLGNFSVNHLVRVRVSGDRVDLRYILDQAEIPTFQERGEPDAAVLARKVAAVRRGVAVEVDGRRVPWRIAGAPRLTHPPGQGGLPLTRVELVGRAAVHVPRTVAVHDATFEGRVGWKAIVAAPGSGTAVRSTAPANDPTGGLRHYPRDLLQSPADTRSAAFAVRPGAGTLTAPHGQRLGDVAAGDGFAGVLQRALDGRAALALLLLAAFAWGAMHALSPGHGKAMVAAYLVGTRGTARHAAALGVTVTATHTAGVFALGVVTLALSAYVLPEDLYPWLNLVSGVLVLAVGAAILRARVRGVRSARAHAHAHRHGLAHSHHDHGHDHEPPDRLGARSLIAMGASAGLIPCPSALVVLLGAIAQHRVGLGLLLIAVFSAGLACTITGVGLVVVSARSLVRRLPAPGPVVTALPALSTLLILGLGVALTVRAVPGVV